MTEREATGSLESDTIAAISTSMGEAGIGLVRMSGREAFSIAERVFQPVSHKGYRSSMNRKLRYGWIIKDGKPVDEVLVSFMQGPHTYTAEDVVEINAHGGSVSVRRILSLLLEQGCRLAEAGEFTRRAFLNGRMDLSQAEAVLDVIHAKTLKAHEQAIDQLAGGLSEEMGQLKEDCLKLLSRVEYSINFMEDAQEELPLDPLVEGGNKLIDKIKVLLATAENGRLVREGIRTVIVGRPNAGKSSLLNALLRENRAIVTDIPGTTRDSIEESMSLEGVQLRLIDTAGIRKTDDPVESIGVERSLQLMHEADLVLCVIDGSTPLEAEDFALLEEASRVRTLLLLNKEDLTLDPSVREWLSQRGPEDPSLLSISAKEESGLDRLQEAILSLFFREDLREDDRARVTNLRQQQLLKDALASLTEAMNNLERGFSLDAIEVDLRNAYGKLAEITGDRIQEDVLNKIFKDFCVGK